VTESAYPPPNPNNDILRQNIGLVDGTTLSMLSSLSMQFQTTVTGERIEDILGNLAMMFRGSISK